MGILNITPDSFSDGGKYNTQSAWLNHVQSMIKEGADIIDIGGYSSRPGAAYVSEIEEEARLIPAIASIRKEFPFVLISADTFRASIAMKAIEAGANIINDISGGTMDANMFETVAKLNVPYILTHIQGTPETMQINPQYDGVVESLKDFFTERIFLLKELNFDQIILDPGFGFGKTASHNLQLIENISEFSSLQYPVMIGLSRKRSLPEIADLLKRNKETITDFLHWQALASGTKILRVHDVKSAKKLIESFLARK